MAQQDEPLKIIGNESNNVYEIEPGKTTPDPKQQTGEQNVPTDPADGSVRGIHELANNDGSLVETLDTDFHNKPGVAEDENPSGSDRAGYYEARSQGKSDSEEELDALNKGEQQ